MDWIDGWLSRSQDLGGPAKEVREANHLVELILNLAPSSHYMKSRWTRSEGRGRDRLVLSEMCRLCICRPCRCLLCR